MWKRATAVVVEGNEVGVVVIRVFSCVCMFVWVFFRVLFLFIAFFRVLFCSKQEKKQDVFAVKKNKTKRSVIILQSTSQVNSVESLSVVAVAAVSLRKDKTIV